MLHHYESFLGKDEARSVCPPLPTPLPLSEPAGAHVVTCIGECPNGCDEHVTSSQGHMSHAFVNVPMHVTSSQGHASTERSERRTEKRPEDTD